MAIWSKQPPKFLVWLAAGLVSTASLGGCGKSSDKPSAETAPETKKEGDSAPQAGSASAGSASKPATTDRLHQSFFEATRKQPLPDQRPPDAP